jgi:predicted nucleotidyltransferase
MAIWPRFDPEPALRALSGGGVDFVVVGGIAAVLHGSSALTTDLDIMFASKKENLERLGRVLVDLEARLRGVEEDVPFMPDAGTLRRIDVLTLETSAGPLDLLRVPSGAPAYAILRRRAERYDVGGFEVLVASLEDLIAMKQAAGRLKDLAAVEELEVILRLRSE